MKNYYDEKEKEYYSVYRKDLIEYIPGNLKKVLDVGCSEGVFGAMLKAKFNATEVWGIEPFPNSAKEASKKLDKVFDLPVESAIECLDGEQFDCIFFNDVLEHLIDPYSILLKIKKNLSTTGCVFASIPNVLEMENLYKIIRSRDWKYGTQGIMDKTHLRFFSRTSIIRMFKEAGFEIQVIKGINPIISRKFRISKFFLGKIMEDFKYVQFVVVAKIL